VEETAEIKEHQEEIKEHVASERDLILRGGEASGD